MMKHIYFLLVAVLMSCGLPVSAQNVVWQKLSAKETTWEPGSREYPITLKSTPAQSDACDVTGILLDSNMIKLEGEAWLDGDGVRLKVSGIATNGVNVMFYGSVTYVDDETIMYEGTWSVDADGRGVEQPFSCYLFDKDARAKRAEEEREREAKEREIEEARRRETPEYKTQALLEKLFAAKRVGIVKKKKLNWGSALQSLANADAAGALSSIDTDDVIDVIVADGEAKSGALSFDSNSRMQLTLKLKNKSTVQANFKSSRLFELKEPAAYVIAFYSQDMSNVLYFFENAGNNSAFLFSQDKVYKLDKKTVKQIQSIRAD